MLRAAIHQTFKRDVPVTVYWECLTSLNFDEFPLKGIKFDELQHEALNRL